MQQKDEGIKGSNVTVADIALHRLYAHKFPRINALNVINRMHLTLRTKSSNNINENICIIINSITNIYCNATDCSL